MKKLCILLVRLTYVYHDALFRKCKVFWNELFKDPIMAHLYSHSILNSWKQCAG